MGMVEGRTALKVLHEYRSLYIGNVSSWHYYGVM